MKRKREKSGLTLVEILTVIAIIALLIGILMPAATAVRNAAKDVKQKGQFMTIDLALAAWKNDPDLTGDYPDSYFGSAISPVTGQPVLPFGVYCGSQKLAEALLGWDLLGFHPQSAWRHDGLDINGGPGTYDPGNLRLGASFDERKKPFLESGTDYAFKLNELFPLNRSGLNSQPGANRYVLCDVFGATKITMPGGSTVKAGAPILYYKADPTGKFNDPALAPAMTTTNNNGNIYNYIDNLTIVNMKEAEDGVTTPFDENAFYPYIQDPKITAKPTPYNPTSYILISAGADGTYGTPDDIVNFGN